MKRMALLISLISAIGGFSTMADQLFEKDFFKTDDGDLAITFIGHGTIMMEFKGKIIHIDPFGQLADYSKMPKADLILITHDHYDHLDISAIKHIRKKDTTIILAEKCSRSVNDGIVLRNGESKTVFGIEIEAVPAYNIVHKNQNGKPFHPKGEGNGYILTIGGKRFYIGGDTENIPEMKALKDIYVAFLPMNLPYTMTPEMVADAAAAFQPCILYPYHYGDTDAKKLADLLKTSPNIEVRIRRMN